FRAEDPMTTMRLGLLLAGLSAFLIRTSAAQEGASTPPPASSQAGVTKDAIKKFMQAQFSDYTIIAYIQRHPPDPPFSSDDLADLKHWGASDDLILALIETEEPQYPPSADSEPAASEEADGSSTNFDSPSNSVAAAPPVIIIQDRGFYRGRRFDRWGRPL